VDIEAGLRASGELGTYFQEQVDQRRRKMTSDVIGDLVGAEIDGEKLTDEAIISFLRLLLPAGLETTYRSSSNLLYLLLSHPDQLHALQQDRELIPAAIEEALRYETPLVSVPRTTTREVEVHGK
jgi:cytochrome P450